MSGHCDAPCVQCFHKGNRLTRTWWDRGAVLSLCIQTSWFDTYHGLLELNLKTTLRLEATTDGTVQKNSRYASVLYSHRTKFFLVPYSPHDWSWNWLHDLKYAESSVDVWRLSGVIGYQCKKEHISWVSTTASLCNKPVFEMQGRRLQACLDRKSVV